MYFVYYSYPIIQVGSFFFQVINRFSYKKYNLIGGIIINCKIVIAKLQTFMHKSSHTFTKSVTIPSFIVSQFIIELFLLQRKINWCPHDYYQCRSFNNRTINYKDALLRFENTHKLRYLFVRVACSHIFHRP